MKSNRSGGSDGLSPEHLKHTGPIFKSWLCQLFKKGIIIPVHKEKGRDPLTPKSYRANLTLTSVVAKTLEFVLLERLTPIRYECWYTPSHSNSLSIAEASLVLIQFSRAKKLSSSFCQKVTVSLPASMTSHVHLTLWNSVFACSSYTMLVSRKTFGD